MTNIPLETLDAYFAAWNERNDAARKKLVDKAWAEDGSYADREVSLTGRQAIVDHIGGALEAESARTLAKDSLLEGEGGRTGFRWTLSLPEGSSKSGYSAATLDDEGRLKTVRSWEASSAVDKPKSLLGRMRSWSVATWLQVLGLVAIVAYVLLRLPAEIFYDKFDATPEDAGFGEVNFVLRQYAQVIAFYVVIGVAWAAFYLLGMYSGVVLFLLRTVQGRNGRLWEPLVGFAASLGGLLIASGGIDDKEWGLVALGGILLAVSSALPMLPRGASTERRVAHRKFLNWAGAVAVLGSLSFGTLFYALLAFTTASSDADDVKAGFIPDEPSIPVPWRPRPVEVVWTGEKAALELPGCSELAYLGQNDKRVLLYDARADRTVHLSEGDVELIFPDDCDAAANEAPKAAVRLDRLAMTRGQLLLDATRSSDADGSIVGYRWSLPHSATRRQPTLRYRVPPTRRGPVTLTLTVTDDRSAADDLQVVVLPPAATTILFAPGQEQVVPTGRHLLDRLRPYMSGARLVQVDGYADSSGLDGDNLELSQRRASAVRDVLIRRLGVPEEIIRVHAFGERVAVDSNETLEGQTRNRRVVVFIASEA
jgi:outer membrane protein OmpA-like peptidoglycan-associated protein